MCTRHRSNLNGADSAQGLADAIALTEQAGVTPSLNVDRLAEAMYADGCITPPRTDHAKHVAAEYARLSGVPRCIACSEPALPDSPYCKGHDRLATYTAHESAGGIAAND